MLLQFGHRRMPVESQVQVFQAFELLQEFDTIVADGIVEICNLLKTLNVLGVDDWV